MAGLQVPGNCAAIRLPSQLVSDTAVLMLDSPEIEWFYPLLRPYEHYIPVAVKNESFVDVESAIKWAESHPLEVNHTAMNSTSHELQRTGSPRAWLQDCAVVAGPLHCGQVNQICGEVPERARHRLLLLAAAGRLPAAFQGEDGAAIHGPANADQQDVLLALDSCETYMSGWRVIC